MVCEVPTDGFDVLIVGGGAGKVPERISVSDGLPVNLQKNEQLVWLCMNTGYFEYKTKCSFVGSSQGLSIRVMNGVYYRVGAFQGHPVEQEVFTQIDTGALILTDKNLYFTGSKKTFRVSFKKVLAGNPYSDGIGIAEDTASGRTRTFVTGEGWFTNNLISNLLQFGSA